MRLNQQQLGARLWRATNTLRGRPVQGARW